MGFEAHHPVRCYCRCRTLCRRWRGNDPLCARRDVVILPSALKCVAVGPHEPPPTMPHVIIPLPLVLVPCHKDQNSSQFPECSFRRIEPTVDFRFKSGNLLHSSEDEVKIRNDKNESFAAE